jgi:pimeloyl-ACP methyl ester carboxylesterase
MQPSLYRMQRPRAVLPAAVALVAVVLAIIGVIGLRGEPHLHQVTVGGVPMLLARPTSSTVDGKAPGVVVAHGFAGSARLMAGFADTLTGQGFVVVLLDFTGHGNNPRPLNVDDAALPSDLGAAVGYLRSLSYVDPDRIGLVGHSMGASAVVEYGGGHQDIAATVAISLGGGGSTRPRKLLVLYGGLEFPQFRQTAEAAQNTGRAQRVVAVPMVEHISVLYSSRTHEETAAWLSAALGGGSGAVHPRGRLIPGALLLLAFVLMFYPLAVLLLPKRESVERKPLPDLRFGLTLLGGLVVAMLAGRLFGFLPIQVGNYTAGYFLVLGLILTIASWRLARPGGNSPLWTLLLIPYAMCSVTVPVQLGLTNVLPVGARWWLLPVIAVCCGVLLFGAEVASGGHIGRHAIVIVLTAFVLLCGAVVGVAPGFVVLVVPLLAALLVWQAGWAAVLRRRGAPPWLVASVGAFVLAWPIALTLPLA